MESRLMARHVCIGCKPVIDQRTSKVRQEVRMGPREFPGLEFSESPGQFLESLFSTQFNRSTQLITHIRERSSPLVCSAISERYPYRVNYPPGQESLNARLGLPTSHRYQFANHRNPLIVPLIPLTYHAAALGNGHVSDNGKDTETISAEINEF